MNRAERIALTALPLSFGSAYALFGLLRHWRFESGAYDLAIFDQAVWHLSRLEVPASTINGFDNLFGDHFHPVIALFAPLYWVAPFAETLIVAQAALLAASIVPVFLFSQQRLPFRTACLLSAAYGFYWGIQRTAEYDVHELAFAPLVVAAAILWMDRGRWAWFWLAMVALALIKEDLIPLVGAVGLYLAVRGDWRRGGLLMGASCAAFALVIWMVIPAFNRDTGYNYISVYDAVFARPWLLPLTLVTPLVKVRTALLWLLPFGFLTLLSPLAILLLPLALERLLSANQGHWGAIYHYTAPIAPIVAMGAADGFSRLSRRFALGRNAQTAVAGTMLVLAAILPGHLPIWGLFEPESYHLRSRDGGARVALAAIPPDASVVAQSSIAPHLSHRRSIYVLDSRAPDADYVIACSTLNPWPAGRFDELQSLLDERRRRGYTTLLEADGWTVLKRPEAVRSRELSGMVTKY